MAKEDRACVKCSYHKTMYFSSFSRICINSFIAFYVHDVAFVSMWMTQLSTKTSAFLLRHHMNKTQAMKSMSAVNELIFF